MSETPPPVEIKAARASLRDRFSIVWVVPIAALVLALGLAWQNYANRGPQIEIIFTQADGIRAGETEIRYRDVTVGLVNRVSFSEDLSHVVVRARLEADVAQFVDDDASFWAVFPEVTLRGITGLETVLSGVFIEATWDDEPEGVRYVFEALDRAPLTRPGQEGLRIQVRTTDGEGLTDGTPILYKGVEVGRLTNIRIAQDGLASVADAFIEAPHDRLINTATRFWDTSGFSFTIGPDGADLNFQSLAALVSGGITFDTVVSGGSEVQDGHTFRLVFSESEARASAFADPVTEERVAVSELFEDNTAGLAPGAAVQLNGINVGEVTGITGLVDRETFGDSQVRLLATLALRPTRFGLAEDETRSNFLDFLSEQVSSGLRARLASAGLLSGGLRVELAVIEDAEPAALDRNAIPFPVMPSVEADIQDVAATAEGLIRQISELPIESLLDSAANMIESGNRLISNADLQAIPGDVRGLVSEARALVGAEEIQALPSQISATATALEAAATDLQTILAELDAQDGVARVLAAVDSIGTVAAQVGTATEGLPKLVEDVAGLAENVSQLDLAGTIARADAVLDSANALIGSEAAASVPDALATALDGLNATLTDLRADDGVQRIVAALENVGVAARDVSAATDGIPQLVTDLSELADKATALDLEVLVTEATAAVGTVRSFVDSEGMTVLPGNISAVAAELDAALADLRADEGLQRVVAAVEALGAAAADIGTATEGVPQLVTDLSELADKATALELEALIAEANQAVAAVTALVGTEEAAAMPGAVTSAVAELENALVAFNEAEGSSRLVAAIEDAGKAAAQVADATEGLPEVIENLRVLSQRIRDLPLDQVVTEVEGFLASAEALIGTEDARELPAAVNDALLQVTSALAELREGGTVENVNAALASASDAAASIERAANELPRLVNRLNTVLAQSQATVAAIGEDGPLGREARAALRDIQEAADAVASLARAIERRPDSLLRGR